VRVTGRPRRYPQTYKNVGGASLFFFTLNVDAMLNRIKDDQRSARSVSCVAVKVARLRVTEEIR